MKQRVCVIVCVCVCVNSSLSSLADGCVCLQQATSSLIEFGREDDRTTGMGRTDEDTVS